MNRNSDSICKNFFYLIIYFVVKKKMKLIYEYKWISNRLFTCKNKWKIYIKLSYLKYFQKNQIWKFIDSCKIELLLNYFLIIYYIQFRFL